MNDMKFGDDRKPKLNDPSKRQRSSLEEVIGPAYTLRDLADWAQNSGESTVSVAYSAQRVTDDQELRDLAVQLIKLEDEFEKLLVERSIIR